MKDLRFECPNDTTADSVCAIVAVDYVLEVEEPVESDGGFLRYLRLAIVQEIAGPVPNRRRVDRTQPENRRPTLFAWPATRNWVLFVEIPDGPLKQRIASIVGVRRLLPMAEATIQSAPCRVLDGEGEIVAQLFVTKMWAGLDDDASDRTNQALTESKSALLDLHVVLRPVRGHRKDFRRIGREI